MFLLLGYSKPIIGKNGETQATCEKRKVQQIRGFTRA